MVVRRPDRQKLRSDSSSSAGLFAPDLERIVGLGELPEFLGVIAWKELFGLGEDGDGRNAVAKG